MTPDKTHSDALAPCPFCRASAHGYAIEPHSHSPAVLRLVPELPDHPGSYVIKGQCACGSGLIGANEAEVVARWNTRWGSPVVAGEPCGWAMFRPDGSLVHGSCEDSADACLFALSESEVACGKKPGFMAANNGWKPHPIYTTPQPTHAQAGIEWPVMQMIGKRWNT